VAEYIEEKALYVAGEKRDTNVARLFQRFSDRPYSTWLTIEKSLTPYKTRLLTKRPSKLRDMKDLLDKLICMFDPADFTNDKRLTGEFLLGYHCQRLTLNTVKTNKTSDESDIPQEN
jgi:CRISPR-associated protein Csd1